MFPGSHDVCHFRFRKWLENALNRVLWPSPPLPLSFCPNSTSLYLNVDEFDIDDDFCINRYSGERRQGYL